MVWAADNTISLKVLANGDELESLISPINAHGFSYHSNGALPTIDLLVEFHHERYFKNWHDITVLAFPSANLGLQTVRRPINVTSQKIPPKPLIIKYSQGPPPNTKKFEVPIRDLNLKFIEDGSCTIKFAVSIRSQGPRDNAWFSREVAYVDFMYKISGIGQDWVKRIVLNETVTTEEEIEEPRKKIDDKLRKEDIDADVVKMTKAERAREIMRLRALLDENGMLSDNISQENKLTITRDMSKAAL